MHTIATTGCRVTLLCFHCLIKTRGPSAHSGIFFIIIFCCNSELKKLLLVFKTRLFALLTHLSYFLYRLRLLLSDKILPNYPEKSIRVYYSAVLVLFLWLFRCQHGKLLDQCYRPMLRPMVYKPSYVWD